MGDLQIAAIDSGVVAVSARVVDAFRSSLQGTLRLADDSGYDEARRVHNGMIDRRPAMIVGCTCVNDVQVAVRFCADHGVLLSVRGGGHSVPGFAVCDGGVLCDRAGLNHVQVDSDAKTARAGGGTVWRDLDRETTVRGLVTTGGVAPPTGIGGFTLGGGHGFLMRRLGLACDNLISAEVVTARGELLIASTQRNEDLFWALRGGGGNFGVVTNFEYRLHQVGPILGGVLIYPLTSGKEILRLYRDLASDAPDELGLFAGIVTHPDVGSVLGIVVCHTGSNEKGERAIEPLRRFKPIVLDAVQPSPYAAIQSIAEQFNPPGYRNYWKSSYLKGLDDDLIDLLLEHYRTVPASYTHIAIECFGGAVARVPSDATAFHHRGWPFNLLIAGLWETPSGDNANIAWVRNLWQATQPFAASGVYVNYLDRQQDEGQERLRSAYGAEKYERLVSLKRKYDPANLFRMNQNIAPD